MDQLLDYSPSNISFEIRLGKQSTSHLQLHNIADDDIAYKVKTTQLKRYCVRPNAAILRAGEKIQVELVQQACKTEPFDLHDCKDKFLLQVVRLDAIEVPCSNVQDVWKFAPQASIVKVKFIVQLQMAPPEQPTPKDESATPAISALPAVGSKPSDPATPELAASEPSPTAPVLPQSPPRSPVMPSETRQSNQSLPPVVHPSPASPSVTEQQGTTQIESDATPSKTDPSASRDGDAPIEIPTPAIASSSSQKSQSEQHTTEKQTTEAEPAPASTSKDDVDYKSIEYARDRVLNIRTAPKISLASPERSEKQRIAVERAGELVRTINIRQTHIDALNKELTEAKHKLSDAQIAVQPAHDVRYEVNESARVPFAQICLMAVISGALLQFLV